MCLAHATISEYSCGGFLSLADSIQQSFDQEKKWLGRILFKEWGKKTRVHGGPAGVRGTKRCDEGGGERD